MAGLILTALGFYIYSPYLSLTAAPSGPRTSAEPSSSGPSDPSTTSPVPSPTPARPPTAPDPDAHQPPDPGGQQPGIRLVATVLAGGVFEVRETVRLAAPVTSLTLAPPDLRAASGDLRSAHPMATELVIRAGKTLVPLSTRTVRQATTVALRRPSDRFEIRYRLHGSVRVNRPSSAGRALGAVAPLTSRQPGDLPVAVTVRGEAVRNLGCVGLPVDEQACFAGQRPNVRVNRNLPLRAALVQVQLDLRAAAREGRR